MGISQSKLSTKNQGRRTSAVHRQSVDISVDVQRQVPKELKHVEIPQARHDDKFVDLTCQMRRKANFPPVQTVQIPGEVPHVRFRDRVPMSAVHKAEEESFSIFDWDS